MLGIGARCLTSHNLVFKWSRPPPVPAGYRTTPANPVLDVLVGPQAPVPSSSSRLAWDEGTNPFPGRNRKPLLSSASSLLRPSLSTMIVGPHDRPFSGARDPGAGPGGMGANRGKMRGKQKFNRRSGRGLRLSPWREPIPYNLSALRRMHPEPVRGPEPVQDAFVPYSFPAGERMVRTGESTHNHKTLKPIG